MMPQYFIGECARTVGYWYKWYVPRRFWRMYAENSMKPQRRSNSTEPGITVMLMNLKYGGNNNNA